MYFKLKLSVNYNIHLLFYLLSNFFFVETLFKDLSVRRDSPSEKNHFLLSKILFWIILDLWESTTCIMWQVLCFENN